MGPLIFVGVAGLVLWWYFRQQAAMALAAAQQQAPPVPPPAQQNPVISGIINNIPVVGKVVGPIENWAGQKIEALPPTPGIAGSKTDTNFSNSGGATLQLNIWNQQTGWAPWARSVGSGVESGASAVGSGIATGAKAVLHAVEFWNWD